MSGGQFAVPAPERVTLPVVGSEARFPVRRIYCVGKNYVEHIREIGHDERDPPVFFQKPTDSIVHDGGTIPYPPLTSNYHYEVELVAALKSGGYNIRESDAPSHVFGYGIGLDMTRRDLQKTIIEKGLPWEASKAFDHSCPCGPIYPVAEVGHPATGFIRLAVNGAARQDSDIDRMIWKTPEIIAKLSEQYELCPGDIILTGTPSGIGKVEPGDELVGSIEGLGTLTVRIGPKIA